MASKSATSVLYQRVMEETGFYRNGVPTGGVIEAESLRNDNQQLEKRIKYSPVIDPEQINATAIFELSGSPCIYFTQLEQSNPDPRELARLHKLSWNHGLAPMLWVVTPTNVRLYNCYSEPTQNNPDSNLIALFENTEASLKQLNEHASRLQLESGKFWQWQNAKQIDRKKRVDQVLVEDLHASEKKLRAEGLESQVAHALLMRSIFVTYLQDRGILDSKFFRDRFDVDSFTDLLSNASATSILFEWLKVTFNGDMFPVSSGSGENSYEARHLEIVKDFVGGTTEIATGQGRLWRFYDFKVIPVELMSSIYEDFLYSEDSEIAEERSVYYTPINLVDLVLDEVFKKLDGNARVLDLSCGSGLFLVESLRRLVVKRCMSGEEPSRQLVRDTLYTQIYGVDIEPQAVQIAAFSLYLTALELDEELEHNRRISDNLKFQPLIGRNLFADDAFAENTVFSQTEVFKDKQFSAVIGNPPWTKSKLNKLAVDYCDRKRPNIGYPNGYPTAFGTPPDQAFLWRIGDFINNNTQIGLILGGKRFFSNSPDAIQAKESLLKRYKPRVIINLSKLYRDNLFPDSQESPAIVLIAEGRNAKPQDFLYFVCPERSLHFRKHGIIEIGAENIKKLSVYDVASDQDMLKVASWGSARDLALIQRLREFPVIEQVIGKPPKNGFKAGIQNSVSEELLSKKWLPSGEMKRYKIDADQLDFLPYTRLEAPRDPKIYKGPLVIVRQKVDTDGIFAAFSQEDLVYTQKYSGVSVSYGSVHLAHYLNGILNSKIASYFLFFTASSWGVERKEVTAQDLTRFPIPRPNGDNHELVTQIVELEKQLCTVFSHDTELDFKRRLDEAVFNLYGLNEAERILVEDAVGIIIDLYMNREKSPALQRPRLPELELYAMDLISVIHPFLQTLHERALVADVLEVRKSPLQVVKFSFVPAPGREHVVQTIQVQELKAVLNRIAENLPQQIADQIYTRRDLRIYTGQDIYIVKPAQKRYWSRSAGLNDADLILSEHLRVNRAAIG